MKRFVAAAFLAVSASVVSNVQAQSGEIVFGVTASNNLITFNSATPGTVEDNVAISGLQASENIVGLDIRPDNNALYGLGSTGRIYTINVSSGVATQIGSPFGALTGSAFGFDFNPAADRIRIVSDQQQNLRVNPDDAALVSNDAALAYDAGDPNAASTPALAGAAYTTNAAAAASTTLFGIDSALDTLVRQGSPNGTPLSPNAGTLFTMGALGVDTTSEVGFDIAEAKSGRALASLSLAADTGSRLYSIDLGGGRATEIGAIGVNERLVDIAISRAGGFRLDQATYSINENANALAVNVTRVGGSAGPNPSGTPIPVTVKVSTQDGTAVKGTDYTEVSTTISFNDNEQTKSVSIPIVDDQLGEGNKTFTVNLSEETGGAVIQGAGSAAVTILENDIAPTFPDNVSPSVLINTGASISKSRLFRTGLPITILVTEPASIAAQLKVDARTARRAGIGDSETVIGQVTTSVTTVGRIAVRVRVDSNFRNRLNTLRSFNVTAVAVATDAQNNVGSHSRPVAVLPR